MQYKKKISIAQLKYRTAEVIRVNRRYEYQPNTEYEFISDDLLNSDYFISGVVTAHFTFPIHPSDKNFEIWKTLSYPLLPLCYTDQKNNSNLDPISSIGDIIFIEDSTGGIAVIGTQFYGRSLMDSLNPPNVDSAYLPQRYHIQVGDTLEIYSGRILSRMRSMETFNNEIIQGEFQYANSYLSMINSLPCYRVIPNEKYRTEYNAQYFNKVEIIDDVYDGKIKVQKNTPKPDRVSIPGISAGSEGALVQISNVKFDSKLRKSSKENTASDILYLEPGKTYTVSYEDDARYSIDFRICHGTEMAKYFLPMSYSKPFDLIGIVAGTNRYGRYEIWPRTMYDLGKPIPRDYGDLELDVKNASNF